MEYSTVWLICFAVVRQASNEEKGNGDGANHVTAHFGTTQALPLLYFSDELLGGGRLRTGWSFLVWVCACGFIVGPLFWEMADLEGIHHFFFLFPFLIFFALFLALAGLLLQLSLPFPCGP